MGSRGLDFISFMENLLFVEGPFTKRENIYKFRVGDKINFRDVGFW